MTTPQSIEQRADNFRATFQHVTDQVRGTFVGHHALVEQALIAFFCGGHTLIEGAPGLGKTLLVRTIAQSLKLSYARVQCTPDLLPGDVTGTNILTDGPNGARAFSFHRGPIFSNVVLADEINRATPRTQSAFLEAMQEHQVTVFGDTHEIAAPFAVFATENPIEMEGTYPLPEAQLDRFFFKLKMGFPTAEGLGQILDRTTTQQEPKVERVFGLGEILEMRETARAVPVAQPVQDYAIRLTLATHPESELATDMTRRFVRFGSSPRGTQALILGGKVRALLADRLYVASEDIRNVALDALRHRLLLNFDAEAERVNTDAIIEDILQRVSTPSA